MWPLDLFLRHDLGHLGRWENALNLEVEYCRNEGKTRCCFTAQGKRLTSHPPVLTSTLVLALPRFLRGGPYLDLFFAHELLNRTFPVVDWSTRCAG